MKIDIWSDIHVDHWRDRWRAYVPVERSKVLICAGDIGEMCWPRAVDTLKELCKLWEEVYYLPGNHDYYESSFAHIDPILLKLENEISNLTILRTGQIHKLGDYKLIGDTAWVPKHNNLIRYPINDLKLISDILPGMYNRFSAWRDFLQAEADPNTIVVTHHLPAEDCIAAPFKGDNYNCWFMGDCKDIILDKKPKIYIYGHTHHAFDFMLGETRMICNPQGYPGERSSNQLGPITINI
jgi:predicted phosphohydrolase